MSTTTNLLATYITQSQSQKEVTANAAFDTFDKGIAGVLSKSVAGSSNVTLTDAEALNAVHQYTGVLTGNINVIVPSRMKVYIIYNNTTGAFTLTVKTAAGTGIAVTQASQALLYCDATNVLQASVASAAAAGALSSITAAVAGNTISNLDQAQVWQWKLTTNSKIGYRITESTASTATTPVLVQIDTVASSTAIPLLVKARTFESFRVSATTGQLQLPDGDVNTPSIGFASVTNNGMYHTTTGPILAAVGVLALQTVTSGGATFVRFPPGTLAQPSIVTTTGDGTGFCSISANRLSASLSGKLAADFMLGGNGTAGYNKFRIVNAVSDTQGAILEASHCRGGTYGSPTVITTGDDILWQDNTAYVGATGLFVNCAQMKVTTEGTLANTTTGIGGVFVWSTMAVGSAIAERMRLDSKGNFVVSAAALATNATDGFLYIPTCAGTPTGVPTTYTGRVAHVYDTTNDKLYVYNGSWKSATFA